MRKSLLVIACAVCLATVLWVAWETLADEPRPDLRTGSEPVETGSPPEAVASFLEVPPAEQAPRRTEPESPVPAAVEEPLPRIVAGSVVDEEGAPIRMAEVYLESWKGGPQPGNKSLLESRNTWTDASSRFEFRGRPLSSQQSVTASKSGCFPSEGRPVPPGGLEVVLTMRRGGTVAAR